MTLTERQYILSSRWFKYALLMWGATICFFLAYHYASFRNDAESNRWFFIGASCVMASKYQILSWIWSKKDEFGLKWLYFANRSAVLLPEERVAQLKKELNDAFIRGEPCHFGRIVREREELRDRVENLELIIGQAAILIRDSATESDLRNVGYQMEQFIERRFPEDSHWRQEVLRRQAEAQSSKKL